MNPFTIEINMSYYRLEDKDVKKHKYPRFQLIALISTLRLTIKPRLIDDLKNLMEYLQNQMMLPFLQRYKPRRRPLSPSIYPVTHANSAVRRRIIKDWFAYVIWANRLKKVLRNDVCPELFEEEIEQHRHKYEKALEKLRNPRDNGFLDRNMRRDRGYDIGHLNKMVAPVIDEIYERKEIEQSKVNNIFFKNFLQKFVIELKVQSVDIELFSNSSEYYHRNNRIPMLRLVLGRMRVALNIDNSMLNVNVMLENVKILDTLVIENRSHDSTLNETLAAKSGQFNDEEISEFFRRHRNESSIFEPADNNAFESESMRRGDHEDRERRFKESKINKKEETMHTSRQMDPDEFFGFKDKERNPQQNKSKDDSLFNFEGFWRNKLGKIIGLGDKKGGERKETPVKRQELFESQNREYQDDNGNNILERC